MPTSVLLSVKPFFADSIFSGAKTFEFRRALFASPHVNRVVVYASTPVRRVIGEFRIADILSMAPDALWDVTRHGAGISHEYFHQYFEGKAVAHAIGVENARRFSRPRRLDHHYGLRTAPQSFCYLD